MRVSSSRKKKLLLRQYPGSYRYHNGHGSNSQNINQVKGLDSAEAGVSGPIQDRRTSSARRHEPVFTLDIRTRVISVQINKAVKQPIRPSGILA